MKSEVRIQNKEQARIVVKKWLLWRLVILPKSALMNVWKAGSFECRFKFRGDHVVLVITPTGIVTNKSATRLPNLPAALVCLLIGGINTAVYLGYDIGIGGWLGNLGLGAILGCAIGFYLALFPPKRRNRN